MNKKLLTIDLLDNVNEITIRFFNNHNFTKKEIIINEGIKCYIIYVDHMADRRYVEECIIHPLLFFINKPLERDKNLLSELMMKYLVSSSCERAESIEFLCASLLKGKSIILVEGYAEAIICNTASNNYRAIEESSTEKSVKASRESFVENIEMNITMLERKISSHSLKMDKYILGDITQTPVYLVYIDGIIDAKVLENIKGKISSVKTPSMMSAGFIEQFIDNYTLNIFPTAKSTERPDKVAADLLEGKASILVAESSSALVVPATFIEFFQGFDDYSQRTFIATFSRILRFIGVLLVLILDPIYLVVLAYNSELLPFKLVAVLIDSRLNIPLPPFFEILGMELAVEILREGGLRLPSPIGTTLAIVGGLVIGEAATRANLASYSTLFVVAITVISSFLIPNYEMALSIRLLRFPLLLLAQIFGFYGVIFGIYLILVVLIKIESFGVPYFSPIAPMRQKDLKDFLIRFPLMRAIKKPKSYEITDKGEKQNEQGE